MESLVPSLRESLFSPTYELTGELLEVGIDALIDNEALKAIPVVNTISAFCKVGYNLHERNLIKQTLSFIEGFNSGSIDSEQLEKHSQELQNNPKKQEKELGRVIIILGKHIEEIQSKILGSFYLTYIKGAISWEKFCELSEANQRMFVNDYAILHEAINYGGIAINKRELYQVDRLVSLGLLQYKSRPEGMPWSHLGHTDKDIVATSFGRAFYQHMPEMQGNRNKSE